MSKAKYPDVGVLLYGGKREEGFNRNIAGAVGDLITDTGCGNSIEEFAALIGLSDIFLTPDSLGMHLSAALGKATVALVGPTSPWEIDLFGCGEVIYAKNLDCICCYLPSCEKNVNCMNSISAQTALEALGKYL